MSARVYTPEMIQELHQDNLDEAEFQLKTAKSPKRKKDLKGHIEYHKAMVGMMKELIELRKSNPSV
ncbi:hypothetical protein [Roseivirga sp. UBA1976]|uniref:hypothetical protein n=1 Tax=Roseivirga sp. UBA1976 TaxID=1947386 RepID=UPI00257B7C6B|nr:hypothetical protein [Roseivirga sp. UBA1976]|tara:strand:- start:5870 stop:6067 length:198 start_codon:yes stop_codon:yes gene_type:complete